jgi:hypothetical protein
MAALHGQVCTTCSVLLSCGSNIGSVTLFAHTGTQSLIRNSENRKAKVFHGGRLHTKARVLAKHALMRHTLNPHHAGVLCPDARN